MRKFFTDRPLSVLVIVNALHSFVFGLSFLLGWPSAQATWLYGFLNPTVFGLALMSAGVLTVLGLFSKRWCALLERGSDAQAVLWLYAGIAYVTNGAVMYAFNVGLIWSFLSGYLSFGLRLWRRGAQHGRQED